MEKQYLILTTGLVLSGSREEFKKYIDHEKSIPTFSVDGSEEEIFFKVVRNLSHIFAKHYAPEDHEKFQSEIKRISEKYNIEQFRPKN